ncbi:restriction endonuclease subunit S [Tenacibaculum sp. SSH1-16]|uniref:restriction endonuclease subunit S n=1 Tax=Tenacibaculum sp. SSH1-16 TaxID=3136667 RepID=UPI0032C45B8C
MNKEWDYGILDDAVTKGSSNISLNKIKNDDGNYPVFGAKGFAKNVSFFHQEEEYLAIIKDGAGIGRVSRHPAKSSIVATMQYIIPKPGYDIDFVKYFLLGLDFEKYRTGSTIPHVYYKDYKNVEFPLINLSEQQQIVEILDQAFAAIDQAKVNIEKNIENAKELFQSKLNQIFSQTGEGWEEKTWKEVLEIRSGRNQKEVESPNGKYPILGSAGKVMAYANKYICEAGTTIIGRKGTINNPMYIETRFWNVDTAFGLHALEGLNKRFLYFFCLSYDFTKRDKGSGRPSLVKNDLLKMTMPIPDLKSQNKIVTVCEEIKNKVEIIESQYLKKIDSLEELKKSILQKAFAGELTQKEIAI